MNEPIPDEMLIAVFAMHNLPRFGRVKVRSLLPHLKAFSEDNSNPGRNFLNQTQHFPNLSRGLVEDALKKAKEQLGRAKALDLTVLVYGWPSYPSRLRRLPDPPNILFVRGQFEPDAPAVAVIGTRNNSAWGEATARTCASRIADHGAVIVSGLALGIDSIAQRAVVEKGARTWAVLAHGLHTISPSSNRALAAQILENGGALISEYFPGEHAQRSYFVERDRIQAGLSQAVLVIETGPDGGSMHTVRFGKEAGVPIWTTFPQHLLSHAEHNESTLPEQQKGSWILLKEGALRVSCASDIERIVNNSRLTAATEAASPTTTSHPKLF